MIIYLIEFCFILVFSFFYLGCKIKNKKSKKIYLIVCFSMLTIVAALRKYTVGIDLQYLYYHKFFEIASLSMSQLGYSNLEIGYTLLNKIIYLLFREPQFLIVITSMLTIPIYGIFIYKNSKDVVLSTFMYFLINIYFMSMNIIRQEIAVAIILFAYELLKKNKKVYFIILVLLATSIHLSAIICLSFLFFFNNKKINLKTLIKIGLLVFVLMIFYKQFIQIFSNLTSFLGMNNNKDYTFYLENTKHSGSIINTNNITTLIMSMFFLTITYYYCIIINMSKDKEEHFYVWMTFFYMILVIVSMKMEVLGRISYYVIPFILTAVANSLAYVKIRNNKIILISLLSVGLLTRYFYILFNLAGILYGVTPYIVFYN